jgi:hypothetical protein
MNGDDFEIDNMKMRLRNRYSGFPYENQKQFKQNKINNKLIIEHKKYS